MSWSLGRFAETELARQLIVKNSYFLEEKHPLVVVEVVSGLHWPPVQELSVVNDLFVFGR